MRVAAEVRAWKGRLQMTQAEMAELLGVSQGSISARLNGHAQFTLDELDVLAARFGIDAADLLTPSAPGPRPPLETSDTRQAA